MTLSFLGYTDFLSRFIKANCIGYWLPKRLPTQDTDPVINRNQNNVLSHKVIGPIDIALAGPVFESTAMDPHHHRTFWSFDRWTVDIQIEAIVASD